MLFGQTEPGLKIEGSDGFSPLTCSPWGAEEKVAATMEPKVICVLLVVFSLALSAQAQGQAGKTAPFLLLGGHREQGVGSSFHTANLGAKCCSRPMQDCRRQRQVVIAPGFKVCKPFENRWEEADSFQRQHGILGSSSILHFKEQALMEGIRLHF